MNDLCPRLGYSNIYFSLQFSSKFIYEAELTSS